MPSASTVDVSRGGLLLAFTEPIGFTPGGDVLLSFDVDGEHLHLRATVVRAERGLDFRGYVAVQFVDPDDDTVGELYDRLVDADLV